MQNVLIVLIFLHNSIELSRSPETTHKPMNVIDRGIRLGFDDHQGDYNHATDSEYKRLRTQADELYQKRNKLSQQSQQAYKAGDGSKAHELSEQSHRALEEAEKCNRKAAEYVFRENNEDSAEDEIDLHGLYVKEAELFLQTRIAAAIRTNQSHLRVIVGKGKHSANGIAKIKPAVAQMCDECRLNHRMDPHNAGVMIIDLSNTQSLQIPNNWGGLSQPTATYHGTSQPHYQQQSQHHSQQYNQHNNFGKIKTGNQLADILIKMFCMCINKK